MLAFCLAVAASDARDGKYDGISKPQALSPPSKAKSRLCTERFFARKKVKRGNT